MSTEKFVWRGEVVQVGNLPTNRETPQMSGGPTSGLAEGRVERAVGELDRVRARHEALRCAVRAYLDVLSRGKSYLIPAVEADALERLEVMVDIAAGPELAERGGRVWLDELFAAAPF